MGSALILCCYVTLADRPNNRGVLEDETRDFVEARAGTLVEVTGNDYNYFSTLKKYWTGVSDLILIEQDVVPDGAAFDEMESCSELWCGCPYNIGGQSAICLGCTRFSAELQRLIPDLFDRIAQLQHGDRTPHRWVYLDTSIDFVLRQEEGLQPHEHGPARHLKTY